ncbi:hypothetical protein [Nonomuraea sediminis]|uniref:hypothetical protein n=1 Tax=Nonomuraea sediminis TaxID=2835864 RepID=UPI001BDBFE3C|nr:hypothetical protein [Nonomuraea sediminis]
MTEIDNKAPRRRLLRLPVLAPALGLAAAVAVSVPLLFGGTPAYALIKSPDGLIGITINEVKDPKKLQADLRDMGANVVVDYIPEGKKCSPQPRSSHFLSKEEAPLAVFPAPDPESDFVINPKLIGPGQTGVLEFNVEKIEGDEVTIEDHAVVDLGEKAQDSVVASLWARVGEGPIADCTLVDTTDAPLSH